VSEFFHKAVHELRRHIVDIERAIKALKTLPVYHTYWVRAPRTADKNKGYVGVSYNPQMRLKMLKDVGIAPRNATVEVLFRGPKTKCLVLENQLRPDWDIGWNKAPGGRWFASGRAHWICGDIDYLEWVAKEFLQQRLPRLERMTSEERVQLRAMRKAEQCRLTLLLRSVS
jgi:hypothetical protein